MRTDYLRIALASYFVELIELVTEAEHPVPELFDLIRRALGYLNRQAAAIRPLEHFESELTRLLGIQHPSVTAAAAIGRAYHHLPKDRAALVRDLEGAAGA